MNRRSRRVVVLRAMVVTVMVMVMVLPACGVPGTGPRSIDVGGVPGLLEPTTTIGSTTTTTSGVGVETSIPQPAIPPVDVFVVRPDGAQLSQVEAPVSVDLGASVVDDARERLRALREFSFSDLETEAGYTTTLGATSVRVTGVTDDRVVEIDLRNLPERPSEQRLAFAQLVWTLTNADGITSVRFTIEGDPVRALTWSGELADFAEPVDRSDYLSAYTGNTPSEPAPETTTFPTEPSPTTVPVAAATSVPGATETSVGSSGTTPISEPPPSGP